MALTKVTGEGVGTLSSSGATTATFNRTTSDGTIVDLKKDGTTVGSIQTKDSRLFINGSQGSTPAGIYFGGGGDVLPASTTNAVDNSISLGGTGHRFKDLYLSGGVYLGGTGSANKLSDVETGTWTPSISFSSGGTVAYTRQEGSYTKIGRNVYVDFALIFTTSGASGTLRLDGLPFAHAVDSTNDRGVLNLGYINNINASDMTFLMQQSTNVAEAHFYNGSHKATAVTNAQLNAGDKNFHGSGTYKTS